MLVEMLPEQVADGWKLLEKVIKEGLPPFADKSNDKMNNILMSILTRKMICWVSYQNQEKVEVDTVVLTSVIVDEISGTRNLLIYCINALKVMEAKVYEDAVDKMTKYARSMKCSKIIGYLADEQLIDLVEKYNGDCSYRLMTFDLE